MRTRTLPQRIARAIGAGLFFCVFASVLWALSSEPLADFFRHVGRTAAPSPKLRPYPRGRWRLASEDLGHVVLEVSQIIFRYELSEDDRLYFRTPAWDPDPKYTRTREEAIALAQRAVKFLKSEPSKFDDMARSTSDDPVTAPWGGRLGTRTAARLPPEFLDAIATMKPGDVSLPFETSFGIYVIRLDATPAEQGLAAKRIVVKYVGAAAGGVRKGHQEPRSRAEALKLATRIADEAVRSPSSFSNLVQESSESPDVDQAGDIGLWSNWSPMGRGLELEVIGGVPVGGITSPVDSPFGFEVFQRMPPEPRPSFAAAYIFFPFPGDAPDEAAQAQTRAQASNAAGILGDHPEQFDELRHRHCCIRPESWSKGRGPGASIDAALDRLKVGEIWPDPVETPFGVYLLKRLELPQPQPQAQILTTLPAPTEPDLDRVMARTTPAGIMETIQSLATVAHAELGLSARGNARLDELLRGLSTDLSHAPPESRRDVATAFWANTGEVLSPSELTHLHQLAEELATRQLMRLY